MTGRRKKDKRALRTAPLVVETRPAPRRSFARWLVALLVVLGGTAFVVRRCVAAAEWAPAVPENLDEFDLEVQKLIQEHARVAREKPSAESHGTLGMVYEANGLWVHAERSYRIAAELARAAPLWSLHRGIALTHLGRLEDALVVFRGLVVPPLESAGAHYRLADALLTSGALDEALAHFEAAERLAPERAEAHVGLGAALCQAARFEEARVQLEQAVRLDPSLRSAHYQLGLALRGLGRKEHATRELALGVDAEKQALPDALSARVAAFKVGYGSRLDRAWDLLDRGRNLEAIAVLEDMQRQLPNDTNVLNNLAVAYLRTGKAQRSHELLVRAKEIDGQAFATWINLAAWGLQTGDLEQGLAAADRAVVLAAKVGTAHLVRGNLLVAKGRLEDAYAALKEAVKLDALKPEVHHVLGQVCTRLERYEEARTHLSAAAQLAPGLCEAQLDLAEVHLLLGSIEAARQALAAARRITPDHPGVARLAREIEGRAGGR